MAKSKVTRKGLRHDGLTDAVFSFTLHFQKYRKVYVSLLALIVIGAIFTGVFIQHRSRRVTQAERLLARARSPLDLEKVYTDYPETKSAPLALLLLADVLYGEGQYREARERYGLFGKKFPQHEFAPLALMGVAYSLESEGTWDDAVSGYRQVGQVFPQSFLVAEALFNIGRCQIQLGRPEEAMSVYEEVLTLYPQSSYVRLAAEQLSRLKSEIAQSG